jgi:hypothetical protein
MTHAQEVAWAAGLFEGEGCFYFNPNTGQMGAMVGSTDKDVLETFKRVVGFGMIYRRTLRKAHHKPQWYWQANRLVETVALFGTLRKHLHPRRCERYLQCLALREEYESKRPRVRNHVALLKGAKP